MRKIKPPAFFQNTSYMEENLISFIYLFILFIYYIFGTYNKKYIKNDKKAGLPGHNKSEQALTPERWVYPTAAFCQNNTLKL